MLTSRAEVFEVRLCSGRFVPRPPFSSRSCRCSTRLARRRARGRGVRALGAPRCGAVGGDVHDQLVHVRRGLHRLVGGAERVLCAVLRLEPAGAEPAAELQQLWLRPLGRGGDMEQRLQQHLAVGRPSRGLLQHEKHVRSVGDVREYGNSFWVRDYDKDWLGNSQSYWNLVNGYADCLPVTGNYSIYMAAGSASLLRVGRVCAAHARARLLACADACARAAQTPGRRRTRATAR